MITLDIRMPRVDKWFARIAQAMGKEALERKLDWHNTLRDVAHEAMLGLMQRYIKAAPVSFWPPMAESTRLNRALTWEADKPLLGDIAESLTNAESPYHVFDIAGDTVTFGTSHPWAALHDEGKEFSRGKVKPVERKSLRWIGAGGHEVYRTHANEAPRIKIPARKLLPEVEEVERALVDAVAERMKHKFRDYASELKLRAEGEWADRHLSAQEIAAMMKGL